MKTESNKNSLTKKILSKTAVIGVIGMGNVGLSLLDAFGKGGFNLVGYDYDANKVKKLKQKESYLNFMDMTPLFNLIDSKLFEPSDDPFVLNKADIIIISV